jgi:hypothetical protein
MDEGKALVRSLCLSSNYRNANACYTQPFSRVEKCLTSQQGEVYTTTSLHASEPFKNVSLAVSAVKMYFRLCFLLY